MDRNREEVESMNLTISCTTGTRLDLPVPVEETVDGLKRKLSQKLRVPKDKLMLLLRDTRLSSGKLQDFGVGDGSRLTLVPAVEAGLMSQSLGPEQSVLQALESLTDAQVSDFLSGRSPLTLALRVGDHMMFVQLQLAAQPTPPQHLPCRGSPPACSPDHAHSVPSPAPATPIPQSSRQPHTPGALIESLMSHAPGVFSGTFSGTLHGTCQGSSGRPRRDITTILQILNDLLSATRHYRGTPPSLAHLRCHTPCPPASPPSATSQQRHLHTKPSGECLRQTENKATRCKVQQLQLLLRQRRLRRKGRRDPRGPYGWPANHKAAHHHHHHHHHGRRSSDGSLEEFVLA